MGGGDYKTSSFDRVQALRQPGSTFKLFPFLAALEGRVSPIDPISCPPLDYVSVCSRGAALADGTASVIDGFALSENVVALRLGNKAGLDQVVNLARKLGISTPLVAEYQPFSAARKPIFMRWQGPMR